MEGMRGLIKLNKKHDILQQYMFEGKSKRSIASELHVSRNTVRKYINEYEEARNNLLLNGEEIDKDRIIKLISQESKYDSSKRRPTVITEEIIDKIKFYLKQNDKYKQLGIKKQCMKAIDIHDALIEDGYTLSYSTTCGYVNRLQEKAKEAYIKQDYDYGDICEFDWGDVKLDINGKIKVFKMAVFTSAKGNYRFAVLYRKEATQFFLDAHVMFFEHTGGVYKTMVYDNMRVAVAKFIGKTEKEATKGLKSISLYYGFNYRFCNARKGNEKGHVEKSVEYIRRKAFSKNIEFNSLEEANTYLLSILDKLNNQTKKALDNRSPLQVFEIEKEHLLQKPPTYDIAVSKDLRVDKYSTIIIEGNKYSIPDNLVSKFVFVKIYPNKIRCYYKNTLIVTHKRLYGFNQWSLEIEHYKRTLLKKPGAISGSLAFKQINAKLQEIYHSHFVDQPKTFIEFLDLVTAYGLNEIEDVIKTLENNSVNITLDSIKLLISRAFNKYNYTENIDDVKGQNDEILKYASKALEQYNNLLGDTDDFMKEVCI